MFVRSVRDYQGFERIIKRLILNDMETDIVYRNESGVAVTTSLIVANFFDKNHKHVMEAIQDIIVMAEKSALTEIQEVSTYFELTNYEVSLNNGTGAVRKYPMYVMNEEGFTHLAMGFTGEKARLFKQRYIKAFKAMRNTIQQQSFQLSSDFMRTQMQMMQQMMTLCTSMKHRMDRIEQDFVSDTAKVSEVKREQLVHSTSRPRELNGELWKKCIMTYSELRLYYPDYKNTHDVAKELRRRGIQIFQRGLFKYLRTKGHLSDGEYTFNRPSEECAMNHHMVAVSSGRSGRTGGKRAFVPYHSPAFVDILEDELRSVRRTIHQPYLPLEEYGKEVEG